MRTKKYFLSLLFLVSIPALAVDYEKCKSLNHSNKSWARIAESYEIKYISILTNNKCFYMFDYQNSSQLDAYETYTKCLNDLIPKNTEKYYFIDDGPFMDFYSKTARDAYKYSRKFRNDMKKEKCPYY